MPAIIQGDVEFGTGSLKERGRGNEKDKVHQHLLVVARERPAVDKLRSEEVLVPNVKATKDLDLRPFTAFPALADSPLHTPYQLTDLILTRLIVLSIRRRKPKAYKPVAATVVQVMGHFNPEMFHNLMFCDIFCICLSRLGGPS
jgi:hypothetical protein